MRPLTGPGAMPEPASLRLRLIVLFAAALAGAIAALAVGGIWIHARWTQSGPTAAITGGVIIAGFGVLACLLAAWFWLDDRIARPLARLAADLRAQAHAEGQEPVFDSATWPCLGDLAPAAGAVVAELSTTRRKLAEAIARHTERLREEKARLEALLADVPAAVLLCSDSHRLVFYNAPARDMLGTDPGPALGRELFDCLRRAPIMHAHERLVAVGDVESVADLMVATADGARILSGRMRLLSADGADGYVLTLRDVTADLAAQAGRDMLLEEIFDRIRRPTANLQTMIGVLAEEGQDALMTPALVGEARALAQTVNELADRYEALRGAWTVLPHSRAGDLADGIRARVEAAGVAITTEADDLILRCDGFEIAALVSHLARCVAREVRVTALELRIEQDGAGAMLSLAWRGPSVTVAQLETWLSQPVDPAAGDLTGRSVLVVHATECWPEHLGDDACAIRLPIRDARRAGPPPAPLARHVVYDFDLLFAPATEALENTPLDRLTYVVFDTETTGLLPDEGDEIVQIAALRLVNGRRVPGEVLDLLVNPGRPIPPRATAVHGISDAMVADAPDPVQAIARFHGFAEGAVLIAHNAPFDMTFLRRREEQIGRRFDNPILDTVLLSAVVYGRTESHSLDALAHRLGVTIPQEARHTALGDTIATAEVFLKLLPILKGRGIVTFGDVLTEIRKHSSLLRDLNA